MRILLLGGSGLLSAAAVEAFLAADHDVSALSRGGQARASHLKLSHLTADRADATSLARVLSGQRFDFTVDFLAFDAPDVRRLLEVPGFEPGRLAMISSGQVYLVTATQRPPFREEDAELAPMPEPAAGTRDHAEWAYGLGKRAAEAELQALASRNGLLAIALRPPVIQGERDGVHSRRLWGWLERMLDGGPVLLPEQGVQRVRFLYAGDAAAALVALATASAWPVQPALNLAQPDEPTLREFLEKVAMRAGVAPRFVGVSTRTLVDAGLAESCAPYWGRWCSRPDPSLGLALLGLETRGVDEYLPSVVRAHLEQRPTASHPGYARRSQELALAARLP